MLAVAGHAQIVKPSISVYGSSAGPTPFIARLNLKLSPAAGISQVTWVVRPKPTSVTRPISATYSANYMRNRGFLTGTGALNLPVFGLYSNYTNTVDVVATFVQGGTVQTTLTITTPAWVDPTGGDYTSPTVVQPRDPTLALNYDYYMIKGWAAPISPIIVDTDGEVRWIGTAGLKSVPAIFYDNSIFLSNGSTVLRMQLDGAYYNFTDYTSIGVTGTGHHNYDPGRDGILVEVMTTSEFASAIIEIDRLGNLLRTWSLANIISSAMIAGGDDPSQFVRPEEDWFHNNSNTYWQADNSLIVSSRENFVIALDYDSGAIKWILGDPTKAWYQYPSLRKYALTLDGLTLPPIGQHSVSIAHDGNLLLFDNGKASDHQTPEGDNRSYSSPRKYRINPRSMTATSTWNYWTGLNTYSPYCSSVYEDGVQHYLINYVLSGDVIGLNSQQKVVFHYKYAPGAEQSGCPLAWNAIPIHLENVVYN